MLPGYQLQNCLQVFAADTTILSTRVADSSVPINVKDMGKQLRVGDVVFIHIPKFPFTKVADTTSSWTNHVGVVTDISGTDPVISESRVPVAGNTTWTRFVSRSRAGRIAITRLPEPLNAQQQFNLKKAVEKRRGILYDTGFNLDSRHREFCSRYVREVLNESVGIELGEIESFAVLLKHNPDADQKFWRAWYFGKIPWQRNTITPASLLRDVRMQVVFDGQLQ
jgi:hypothetical protein